MIVDARETDWPLIESIAMRAAVFTEEELGALAAVWEEYALLGPDDSGYQFLVDRAAAQVPAAQVPAGQGAAGQAGDAGRSGAARQGGAILGFVCHGPRDLTDGVHELYYLAVAPDAQGQEVGRRLLRAGEAEAREAGARMMLAEIPGRPAWEPVGRFLRSAAYEPEATIKDYYSVGDDLTVFVKRF